MPTTPGASRPRDAYAEQIKKAGGEVVGTTGIPLGTADMTPFLSKITGDFDGLFGIFFGKDGVTIGNQAFDLGLTKKYKWAGDGAIAESTNLPALGNKIEGFVGINRYVPVLDAPLNTPAHKKFFDEAVARLKQIDPSGPLPDRYVQSNYEAMNALKLGMEKSGFQGREDTMKLIEALEGLEMKEGDDFPQGDKMLRKEDHQAFLREFIFEIKDGKHRIVEVVPKEKTIVPAGLQVRLSDRRRLRSIARLPGRQLAGEAPPPPVLRTEGLTVRFGGLTALNNVNFEVQRGEIRAIIGPNGAGKSTFFNCLTGVLRPTVGAHPVQRRGHHRAAAQPHLAEGHRPLLPDHQHPAQRHHARERAHRRPVAAARLEHADPPPRLPRHHRQGEGGAGGGRPARPRPTSWPPTSRTASSATSRSASRSPPSRSSCASTSRRPA